MNSGKRKIFHSEFAKKIIKLKLIRQIKRQFYTLNFLSFSRIILKFTLISQITFLIHNQFSRTPIELTICFPNALSIHYLYRELTTNAFSYSRILNGFTIFFTNLLRIHLYFPELTYNSLAISRIQNELTIFFAN